MASKFQSSIIKEKEKQGFTVLKIIRLSENGYPDLLCIHPELPDEWIECKEANDTLKPLQKHRIDQLNNMGKKAYCMQKGKGIIYPTTPSSDQ